MDLAPLDQRDPAVERMRLEGLLQEMVLRGQEVAQVEEVLARTVNLILN